GSLPTGWTSEKLKFRLANIVDQTVERRSHEKYVALEHIESWTGKVNLPEEVPTFESAVKRFRSGDLLFGKLRPYLAKAVLPQFDGVAVGELLVLRQTKNDNPQFLLYLLLSKP